MHKGPLIFLFALLMASAITVHAEKYELKNGEIIEGEASTMSPQGIIFRRSPVPPGKTPFTERVPWNELTQATLKMFLNDPKAKRYVDLLIELPPEQIQAQLEVEIPEMRKPEIVIGDKPSPGRQFAGASLMGALFSGGGLVILGLLYGANLFASYEIGTFRNYPGFMVAGIAAALPFITPIVWLCLPRRVVVEVEETEEETEEEQEIAQEQAEHQAAMAAAAAAVAPVVESKPIPPTKYFKRGEFNINRRFIETKFAGFFRAIPNDEDRDLFLVIKSARGEFSGRRILKITNTEMTFQVPKGETASVDEVIPLNDVLEIQVRHKDATD